MREREAFTSWHNLYDNSRTARFPGRPGCHTAFEQCLVIVDISTITPIGIDRMRCENALQATKKPHFLIKCDFVVACW
ncbi:MAG: hypothetical protein Q4G00_16390 [Clostridia bacterium]|nr:hypothetical protein [Clostridia bacterium]